MRIASVAVALPKTFKMEDGEEFQTSIFKESVETKVWARNNAIEGDEPSDKEFHGGVYQAVYTYAAEHYPYWKEDLGLAEMPYGMFGENITTEGLDESEVWIGDQFRFGEALLEATAPRIPCETLGFRFKNQHIVKKFMTARKMGIYFKIVEEGPLGKGDEIRSEKKRRDTAPILDLVGVYADKDFDKTRLKELLQIKEIPPANRKYLEKRLG